MNVRCVSDCSAVALYKWYLIEAVHKVLCSCKLLGVYFSL